MKALKEFVDRMKYWENRFRPLAAERTITRLEFLELQSRRLMSEIWLAREMHKPSKP